MEDYRKITDHFRGIYRIYPNLIKENRRMWTCNRLDLQTLGFQPVMPKNLPEHWCICRKNIIILKITFGMEYRVANFYCTWLWNVRRCDHPEPLDEGHVHMLTWPRKCDPIDFKFSQQECMVVLVHIGAVGLEENKVVFDVPKNGMWRLERLGVENSRWVHEQLSDWCSNILTQSIKRLEV